jgi:TonB family protein
LTLAGLLVVCLPAGVFAQPSWTPARWREGAPPPIPVEAVAGGEVFVEVTVTDAGRVSDVAALRSTAPFTQYVLNTVRDWRFQPAEQMGPADPGDPGSLVARRVPSKVMVACIFRPPTLNGPTLGESPRNVQPAATDVAVPLNTVTPPYPPMAVVDAVVMVQVIVGINGSVRSAIAVRSAPGFDEAALAAAREWMFRPARIHGLLEETLAYIVFAFRQPVTLSP